MSDNEKTKEFLKKLAPCIERGELEACLEEAARVAWEMGIGAEELSDLSIKKGSEKEYEFAYVLALAAGNYNNAGLAVKNMGKLKEAEEYFKKAIEINPKFAEAHNNYANLLKELNRKAEAEKYYEKAIELDPKNAAIYNNYANLLKELNRKAEAEKYFKKAIELDRENPWLHNNYALLLEELNRKAEAEMQYKKVIEAYPKFAEAHSNYGLLLIYFDKRSEAWKEIELASNIFKETGRITQSYLAKAWFYERNSKKNLDSKKFQESSEEINKAGEEYLKVSETVEGEIKYAFELKGNVCKAQSFIRKEHKTNQELVNDLKNASEFYKKASVCPAGGTEETCGACYSVMEVFSQALTSLEGVVHNEKPSIRKEEWNVKLEKSNEIYLKKGSEKGVALVAALKELIKCVDELAYYTARKSSLQKKRLKECYKTLEDVSSKVEGGLRNIIDPTNEVIKDYSKKIGIPMPEEKALDEPSSTRNIKKLVGYFIILLGVIGGIIAILQFLKLDSSALEFIKSLISRIGIT